MVDFKDKIVYQIYPKSFMDSNGDGIGDLRGIISKLNYLKELGVDYLWLTPFYLSPQRDNGYDIEDYYKIDPCFGTMEDFECLVKEARMRGLKIILDMVFNHTSTRHLWFHKAIEGEREYQNYYFFRDGMQNQPPTNWQSKLGGSAWEYLPQFGKWYLHLFDVTQADLNWSNERVRERLKEILLFWKGKGVEGFQFDVINLVSKPKVFEDDIESDGRKYYTDGPKIHEYIKEIIKDTGLESVLTIGEMSCATISHCIRYTNPAEKELNLCVHFHHLRADDINQNKWEQAPLDYRQFKQILMEWQLGMQQKDGWSALFLGNHDHPRAVSRFTRNIDYWREAAKMLATLSILMRGTPFIFQGEEIGMINPNFDRIEQYRDIESQNLYNTLLQMGKTEAKAMEVIKERSRDNARTPMQWNDQEYAGFSSVKPWIDVADNYHTINVAKERKQPGSIFTFYQRLIAIRKHSRAVSHGTIHFFLEDVDYVLAFERCYEKEKVFVICNLQSEGVRINNKKLEDLLCTQYDYELGNYANSIWLFEWYLKPYEVIIMNSRRSSDEGV